MFDTLLIANRGEIARRIMRSARRLGIRCVAVYSDADAAASHVGDADEAVRVGPAPAAESYLRIDAILEAARATGAQAIHPGYGFLSENADFADACAEAGITFVGPPSAAIRAMGRKDEAKALMAQAGVPVTPGYHGRDQNERALAKAAREIGFPVLIKAVAGGGGKGMRRVDAADQFADALESARREGAASFGDDRVLIEKFITDPRHIEVQIFGDSHGRVIHMFERDCSLQRRHQKVIEEAPAPGVDAALRDALCAAAVRAGEAVSYEGAGTVEFILDGSGALSAERAYFMEMNTRLQVEHPVTEMITGLDLVALQLKVAAGEPLPAQDEITMTGWAIEARVYAEDPATGFLPSIGPIDTLDIGALGLKGANLRLRWDGGVEPGDAVGPHYDPMIGKLAAWAQDRETAAQALSASLQATRLAPLRANTGFLARCLEHPAFRSGSHDTGLIDREGPGLTHPSPDAAWRRAALAGLARYARRRAGASRAARDPWDALDGWRLNAPPRIIERFDMAGAAVQVVLAFPNGPDGLLDGFVPVVITVDGETREGEAAVRALDRPVFRDADGAHAAAAVRGPGETIALFHLGDYAPVGPVRSGLDVEAGPGGDAVAAPMPGLVRVVKVAPGDQVARGDPLIVLEAMKMEHALAAPRDGEVAALAAAEGDQVQEGDVLVRLVEDNG